MIDENAWDEYEDARELAWGDRLRVKNNRRARRERRELDKARKGLAQ
jgi:hypothetical protein